MAFARIALSLRALPDFRCLLIFATSLARSFVFLDFMTAADRRAIQVQVADSLAVAF